jgi:23S rRNA (uridine2552-2'-O)-methyltransferase
VNIVGTMMYSSALPRASRRFKHLNFLHIIYQESSSKAWMKRHVNDAYVKQAADQSLRSRAYFKLIEIQDRYKFINKHSSIIDLGASPGGWSLAASGLVDPTSASAGILAVDLLPMDPIPKVKFIQGDFTCDDIQNQIISECSGKPTVILSDMLGNSTGQHQVDHYRSIELAMKAYDFSERILSGKGSFLCKYLRGSDEKLFVDKVRSRFAKVDIVKPKASRSESSEVYLLARDMKNGR